jgi:hypothetical protein
MDLHPTFDMSLGGYILIACFFLVVLFEHKHLYNTIGINVKIDLNFNYFLRWWRDMGYLQDQIA